MGVRMKNTVKLSAVRVLHLHKSQLRCEVGHNFRRCSMFQMPETLRVWAPLNSASSLSLALPTKLRSDILAHHKNSI